MRLTLRTLLAYLDDILEAPQAKEIGAKISESGYASTLINRIREVMRKRRLTAPELTGPATGLDPNNVAEYLDNTLGPEAVADVEKVCLDSDLHLAEVAASHQILTIVLGEPVDVPQSTRERMYALGSDSKLQIESNGKQPKSKKQKMPKGDAAAPKPTPADTNSNGAFEDKIPDYLKPAPMWKRIAPVAICLIVGGIWLYVVMFDPTLFSQEDESIADTSGDSADTVAQVAPSENGQGANGSSTIDSDSTSDQSVDSNTKSTDDVNIGDDLNNVVASNQVGNKDISQLPNFDAAPPPDAPEKSQDQATQNPASTAATANADGTGSQSAKTDKTTGPANSATANTITNPNGTAANPTTIAPNSVNTTDTNAAKTANIDANRDNSPNASNQGNAGASQEAVQAPGKNIPMSELVFKSRECLLVRQTKEGWTVMAHRTAIRPGDVISCPEPFIAVLEMADHDLIVELLGGTTVEVLGATKDQALVLDVRNGKVAFRRSDAANQSLSLGLRLAGEPTSLELAPGESLSGIEVIPGEPWSFEAKELTKPIVGNLFVIRGDVSFNGEATEPAAIDAPGWMPLAIEDRKLWAQQENRVPLAQVPEWLDEEGQRVSQTMRRYANRFARGIDDELPIHDSLPNLVTSTIPGISELAVKCLACTSQYSELIQALARSEFEESRAAAITGIRQWLPQDEGNKELLKAELAKNFKPAEIDPIYRLLWGYNEEDARNPASSRILVDWLKSDSVVIRHLAFLHVSRLTGQRHDFRPTNPSNQRRVAVKSWEDHLKKNDGALIGK